MLFFPVPIYQKADRTDNLQMCIIPLKISQKVLFSKEETIKISQILISEDFL